MSQHQHSVDVKVELPFDLNNLFNLSYSFDVLKQAIEFLATNQSHQAKLLTQLKKDFDNQPKAVQQPPQPVQAPVQQPQVPASDDSDKTKFTAENFKMLRDHDNIIRNLRQDVNLLKDLTQSHENLHKEEQKKLDFHSKLIEELQMKVKDHEDRLNEQDSSIMLLKSLGANNSDENGKPGFFEALEKMISKLRQECIAKFADKDDITSLRRRIDDLESDVNELFDKSKNYGISLSQCRDITDENRLQIEDIKRQLKDLLKRIQHKKAPEDPSQPVEINQSPSVLSIGLNIDIDEILRRLQALEDGLDSKVDKIDFQNEVARLREMIGNIEQDEKRDPVEIQSKNQGQTIIKRDFTDKEVQKLKDIIDQFPQQEETVHKLFNDLKSLDIQKIRDQITQLFKIIEGLAERDQLDKTQVELQKIRDQVNRHTQDIRDLQDSLNNKSGKDSNINTNDFMLMRNRLDYIEGQISSFKKQLQDLKRLLEEGGQKEDPIGGGGSSLDDVQSIPVDNDLLNKLKQEIQRLRDEYGSIFKNINDALGKKADKDELTELEARLLEKLNEMLKKLLTQFADKVDTKKRLIVLEKKVQQLLDIMMSRTQNNGMGSEEDAMFTKKPLGGLSCASCERNVNNLYGHIAEYQPWKKLPFREPSDRIARYGPGFSKILSMMRPDQVLEDSRIEQVQNVQRSFQNDPQFYTNHNTSTVQEHSLIVDMPAGVSAKNSARTGNHFYKNSYNGNKTVVMKQYVGGNEESPPRVMNNDNSNELLPNLNIKGSISKNQHLKNH